MKSNLFKSLSNLKVGPYTKDLNEIKITFWFSIYNIYFFLKLIFKDENFQFV